VPRNEGEALASNIPRYSILANKVPPSSRSPGRHALASLSDRTLRPYGRANNKICFFSC